jgi:hypothetical protein
MLIPPTITMFPPVLPHTSRRLLHLDKTRLLLSFKSPQKRPTVEKLLKRTNVNLVLENERPNNEIVSDDRRLRINHTSTEYWVSTPTGTEIIDDQLKSLNSKPWKPMLAWVGPVYSLDGLQELRALLCPLPTALFVKFGERTKTPKVPTPTKLTACLGSPTFKKLTKRSRYRTGYWYVTHKATASMSVYDTALALVDAYKNKKKGAIVESATFDLMPMVKTACAPLAVDDPEYPQQWNLHRINAEDVWPHAQGQGVKVMVLDYGCDLGHPDLFQGRRTSRGIDLQTMQPPGSAMPGESHGTACAGIVGAFINNHYGIAGVAGGCELIPAKIVAGTTSELLDALEHALDKKVDVISFSHDDPKWERDDLNDMITVAAKHIVICAAAGNGGDPTLSYPAKHPDVIACGAVNRDPQDSKQERRRSTSNHGTGLSVVAPGDKILTTWNQNEGTVGSNYDLDYLSGTSAATPHVAGLAALLIGAFQNDLRDNPQEVRRIIQESAEELLPRYSYTDFTVDLNGKKGWNPETGFGLINVLRALRQADHEFNHGATGY